MIKTWIANIKACGFREVRAVSSNRKKNRRSSRKKLEILVTCVHTPDAEARLSQALDMLLAVIPCEPTDHEDSAKNCQQTKS